MDLSIWTYILSILLVSYTWNKTAFDCKSLLRWAKSNESCSGNKQIEANDCLFLLHDQSSSDSGIKAKCDDHFCMVYDICLPKVFKESRKKQKNGRIIFYQDNASSHASAQTTEFLKFSNIELKGHPLYIMIWHQKIILFSHIKAKSREQGFSTLEERIDAFKSHVLVIPSS